MKTLCPLCKAESKFEYEVKGFKYYSCKTCHLLFLHPQPTDEELNEYYETVFSHTAGLANKDKLTIRAKKVINKLLNFHPEGKKILDVGSGLGFILEEARKHGLTTTAIEPSSSLVKNKVYKRFDKVYNSTFDSYIKENKKEKFDFITLTHVIEHIKDPKHFIKTILGLLDKRGILFIETPNLDSHLYWAEKGEYTFLIPPEHVFLFSMKSLSRLLPQSFIIKEVSTYSYSEHFMGIIKRTMNKKTNQKSGLTPKLRSITPENLPLSKKLKILMFDNFIAFIFYPLLNLNHYGSILELYIVKK